MLESILSLIKKDCNAVEHDDMYKYITTKSGNRRMWETTNEWTLRLNLFSLSQRITHEALKGLGGDPEGVRIYPL